MAIFCQIFDLKTGRKRSGQSSGFIWTKFQAKWSILDPIRTIFDDLGSNRHCGPDLKLEDQAGHGPLEWVGPIPTAPERSWHASGPSFRPNHRFLTHYGSNLMFWAGKPGPLSEPSTFVLSQQQTSALSQQQTSVLSQQQTSRRLSCLNRRHLACLNRRQDGCRPPAGCCYVIC